MDPEGKNGEGGQGDVERSGGGDSGNKEPNQNTPLRGQQRKQFIGSERIRIAAAQVHHGGPAGAYALLCGTICCSVILAIVLLIFINLFSITSIIIGSMYLHDCPIEPRIPVLLIVMGVLAFLIGILDTLDRSANRNADGSIDPQEVTKPTCFTCLNSLFKLVQMILFIYSCVVVYRIYSDVDYNHENIAGQLNPNYCEPLVYLFAFWFVTVTLILMAVAAAFLLCICFFAGALLVALSD